LCRIAGLFQLFRGIRETRQRFMCRLFRSLTPVNRDPLHLRCNARMVNVSMSETAAADTSPTEGEEAGQRLLGILRTLVEELRQPSDRTATLGLDDSLERDYAPGQPGPRRTADLRRTGFRCAA